MFKFVSLSKLKLKGKGKKHIKLHKLNILKKKLYF